MTERENDTVIVGLVFYVMLGFNPGIQRHKALAHDMHAESIALQQRFAPQPLMRSSWLQLALYKVFQKPRRTREIIRI